MLVETARQMKQSGHSHMEGAKQNSHKSLEGGKSNTTALSDSQSQPCSSKQLTCESIKDSSVCKEATDREQSPASPPQEKESAPSPSSCASAPETPEKRGVKR